MAKYKIYPEGGYVQNDEWQNYDHTSPYMDILNSLQEQNSIDPYEQQAYYNQQVPSQEQADEYNYNDTRYEELQDQIKDLESRLSESYQSSDTQNSDELMDYILGGSEPGQPIDWSNIQSMIPTSQVQSSEPISNPAKHAYQFFINKGYTPAQAAGIVGNIKHESSFNTSIKGDNGQAQGLVQWHPDRRNRVFSYLESRGLNPNDFNSQLEGIDYELNTSEQSALSKLKTARTPAEAARLFDKHYERSAGKTTGSREAYAEKLYNELNG
jgi:hypothetical protein